MLGKALLIWSSVVVITVNVPTLVNRVRPDSVPNREENVSVLSASVDNKRSYVLSANDQGHFEGRFQINGKPFQAMIDTGATYVTLNEADARNLGYGGNELRFKYKVATANGEAKAARIQLRSVEIGTVQVRNVDALVLRGRQLSGPLVGMSFMNKLNSYSAASDQLELVN